MADEIKSLDELNAVAGGEAVAEVAAPREPVRDELGRSYATGKRKDAVARVWIKPGSGKVTVNGTELRAALKAAGFLTRDSRVVERKKFGKRKARRSFQFSKR